MVVAMPAPLFRFFAAVLALAGALVFAGTGEGRAQPTTRITEEPVVVQPPPFSTRGTSVVVPRTRIEIDEGGKIAPGDPLRRKKALPGAEGETEAETEAAPDPACRGSKILCGDPLRRKQKKRAQPEE